MMRLSRFIVIAGFLVGGLRVLAAAPTAESMEQEVKAIVDGPQVTIVHFWAPWCSNCKNEMSGGGWAEFVAKNPAVRVVFLNVWHKGQDPAPKLRAAKLAGQPNFLALTHPNASNTREEKLERFLDLPVQWVPTTWVFRDGKMRFALNYGEIRFPMLQQMVDDSTASW